MCFILLSYVDETSKFSVDKTGPGARGQRLLLGAELRRSLPKINMMRGLDSKNSSTINVILIILRLHINTCLSYNLSRWVILCSSYLCGRGHQVLPGQDEALEPGVREARLQTWIVPSFMFTREQSLEDDSMMTRTIVTITSLMLLWLPGITGHARHVIFITFWWLSILWQRRLSLSQYSCQVLYQ